MSKIIFSLLAAFKLKSVNQGHTEFADQTVLVLRSPPNKWSAVIKVRFNHKKRWLTPTDHQKY